jgi:hypothetical protein
MTFREHLEQACDLTGHVIDVRVVEEDAKIRLAELSLQELIDDGKDPIEFLPPYLGGPVEALQPHHRERPSKEPELYPGIHCTTEERDRTAKYR